MWLSLQYRTILIMESQKSVSCKMILVLKIVIIVTFFFYVCGGEAFD